MGFQKKKTLDSHGADDEDIDNLDQLLAPVKNIEVILINLFFLF